MINICLYYLQWFDLYKRLVRLEMCDCYDTTRSMVHDQLTTESKDDRSLQDSRNSEASLFYMDGDAINMFTYSTTHSGVFRQERANSIQISFYDGSITLSVWIASFHDMERLLSERVKHVVCSLCVCEIISCRLI